MSKQHELLDLAVLTDWAKVYAAASDTDRKIVDFVRAHPGAVRADIVEGTSIPGATLDYRLWELSGHSTGAYRGDGLLIRERLAVGFHWRYHAREW